MEEINQSIKWWRKKGKKKRKQKKEKRIVLRSFEKVKCYVHNIFTTNYGWLVIIGSKLNLALKLLF